MTRRVYAVLATALIISGCGPATSPSLTPSAGATAPVVATAQASTEPSASPIAGSDGYILFVLEWFGQYELVAMDVASGAWLRAPFGPDDGSWRGAQWTPAGDGLLIAFPTGGPDETSVEWRIATLDAGSATTIDFGEAAVSGVSISPDGAWIAGYVRLADNGVGYWTFQRTDGTASARVDAAGQIVWSHDGAEALILTEDGRLLDVKPATGTMMLIGSSLRSLSGRDTHTSVLWSPDDSEFLYRADDCPLCAMSRGAGALRKLEAPALEQVHEVIGWAPSGIVAISRYDPTRILLLSPDTGEITKTIAEGRIDDAVISIDMRRVAVSEFDMTAGLEYVAIYDLADGTSSRFAVPAGGTVSSIRWQPASFPVPWPVWTEPGPEPTPTIHAGTLELEAHGAFQAITTIQAACEERGGLAISGSVGDVSMQLGVSPDGSPNFLSINGPGFGAFAGKGFDVAPPFVVSTPGSTMADGSLEFSGLPDMQGAGTTVSGTVHWSCSLD